MNSFALLVAALLLVGCGGEGGNSSSTTGSGSGSQNDSLPQGCVEVGSVANTGGDITIIANCTNGSPGANTQNCFQPGKVAGEAPVQIPCNNGGEGQAIGQPTPFGGVS